jgi:hypothetical protein
MNQSDQTIRNANQKLDDAFDDLIGKDIYMGFTGRGDTARTVLVSGKPGFIYVRVPKKVVTGTLEEYSEHIARSENEFRHNVPVKLIRSEDNPSVFEVKGLWPTGMGQSTIDPIIDSIAPHRTAHELYTERGGHDPVMLDTIQLRNMQVHPTVPASSKVVVDGGWYIWKDRNVHWFSSIEVDLASYIPTGTGDVYISLWYDPDNDTIVETSRQQINVPGFELSIEDLVVWPTQDYIPLACVKVESGQYQIKWSQSKDPNIIDMRPHTAMMPGDMLPAGHQLDPIHGYHSGTLRGWNVTIEDQYNYFTGTTVEEIISYELGPERTRVKVSANDTTPNFLEDKLLAGPNIGLSTLNEGANEKILIQASGTTGTLGTADEILLWLGQ